MTYWNKSDGGFILITFTEPLTGTISGNESHFTVSWNEYTYAPDGLPTVEKTGTVTATHAGELDTQIILEMTGLGRFNNAAGQITVAYDGAGTLIGEGGPVEVFELSFTPTDLLMKPNQHPVEHVQIANATKVSTLIRVYYSGGYSSEHLSIASASWTGTLTHIDDL